MHSARGRAPSQRSLLSFPSADSTPSLNLTVQMANRPILSDAFTDEEQGLHGTVHESETRADLWDQSPLGRAGESCGCRLCGSCPLVFVQLHRIVTASSQSRRFQKLAFAGTGHQAPGPGNRRNAGSPALTPHSTPEARWDSATARFTRRTTYRLVNGESGSSLVTYELDTDAPCTAPDRNSPEAARDFDEAAGRPARCNNTCYRLSSNNVAPAFPSNAAVNTRGSSEQWSS